MTNKAELQSISTESQTEKPPVETSLSSAKPKQDKGICISNCSLPNATFYIRKNFDGKERTVNITVTYSRKGKVTDVQINPSTGNSNYDSIIREDAIKLRFSPGKSRTVRIRLNIVESDSQKVEAQ